MKRDHVIAGSIERKGEERVLGNPFHRAEGESGGERIDKKSLEPGTIPV